MPTVEQPAPLHTALEFSPPSRLARRTPPDRGESPDAPPTRAAGFHVRFRFGPLEQVEHEVLMGPLLRISEGDTWSEIHAWLLEAKASSRVHLIARRLLEAIPTLGLKGVVATPNHEVALELGVSRLDGLGRLAGDLQHLQTPYRITIGADPHYSGAVQASWNLGLDGPSVALRGQLPGDPKWRQRLLTEMSTLLAGGSTTHLPGQPRSVPGPRPTPPRDDAATALSDLRPAPNGVRSASGPPGPGDGGALPKNGAVSAARPRPIAKAVGH